MRSHRDELGDVHGGRPVARVPGRAPVTARLGASAPSVARAVMRMMSPDAPAPARAEAEAAPALEPAVDPFGLHVIQRSPDDDPGPQDQPVVPKLTILSPVSYSPYRKGQTIPIVVSYHGKPNQGALIQCSVTLANGEQRPAGSGLGRTDAEGHANIEMPGGLSTEVSERMWPALPVQLDAWGADQNSGGATPVASVKITYVDVPRQSTDVDDVQRSGGGDEQPEDVHAAAARGLAGPATSLPHADVIQRSFGRHDVGSIDARVGGPAVEASAAMGAKAYATGNSVAFARTPEVHTAAHEAAHVVQQRGDVSVAGGVGQPGDAYERHADAVADAVVAGKSAEPLLDGIG
jgi:hypothetical protein